MVKWRMSVRSWRWRSRGLTKECFWSEFIHHFLDAVAFPGILTQSVPAHQGCPLRSEHTAPLSQNKNVTASLRPCLFRLQGLREMGCAWNIAINIFCRRSNMCLLSAFSELLCVVAERAIAWSQGYFIFCKCTCLGKHIVIPCHFNSLTLKFSHIKVQQLVDYIVVLFLTD